jgi:biopolymer transport protein TolQ
MSGPARRGSQASGFDRCRSVRRPSPSLLTNWPWSHLARLSGLGPYASLHRGSQKTVRGDKISALVLPQIGGQLGQLIQQTGWVSWIILLILLFFSLISWALILQKWAMFGSMNRRTAQFLRIFRASRGLPDPKSISDGRSPLEAVYAAGFREVQSQLGSGNPAGKLKSVSAVTVAMQLASADQLRRIERYMPWLATTGSVTPFIGLFGTVLGVMDAFLGLGSAQAASLSAVAPGIAEALITTAAGLFTAIPAVIAYNQFVHRSREMATRMDNFTMEVASQIEKLSA